MYYTTGGGDPQALRVRLSDHKVEVIVGLKDCPVRQARTSIPKSASHLDGSAVFTATSARRKSAPSP